MKPSNITPDVFIRVAGVAACLAMAAWVGSPIYILRLSLFVFSPWYMAVWELVLGALALSITATFVWIAWRLWRRWNSSTVRWFTGVWVTALLIAANAFITHWASFCTSWTVDVITSVLAIPLLIFGGMIYCYVSRNLIRIAGLHDPADIYGQPIGHQARIRAFAMALGWAIFLAGPAIDRTGNYSGPPNSWPPILFAFGPAILGYSTFKLIIWFNKPRTRAALPAGGFEVITNSSSSDRVRTG